MQSAQAFVSCARHQQRKYVAILCVSRIFAFIVTDHVELILAGLIDKVCRLVHVIPDSRDTVVRISAMQIAPPTPRFGQSEIDKDAVSRPDSGNERLATFAMLKISAGHALIENVVAFVLRLKLGFRRINWRCANRGRLILHPRIDDDHGLDALLRELFRQLLWIGKPVSVESEHAVTVHVMDVQIDYIQRKIAFAILPHHLFDYGLWIVTVPALLNTE